MEKIRQLAPWQIIAAAIGILLVFLIGGYFLVTLLTNVPVAEPATSQIPENLDSKANQKVIEQLDAFEDSNSQPIVTEPLRTPDPNSPSSINPFES